MGMSMNRWRVTAGLPNDHTGKLALSSLNVWHARCQ
jgi:hypothetical protein